MDHESQRDCTSLEVRTLFGDKVSIECSPSQSSWLDIKKQALQELKYVETPSDRLASSYSFLNGIDKLNEEETSCSQYLSSENSKSLTIINTSSIFTTPHIWIGLQFMSSITLTLVNKHLSSFEAPIMIIIIQTIIGVLAFLMCKQLNVLPFNFPTLRELVYLLPTSLFFVLLTWTSFEGLKSASVPLVTITRNLVPLLTAMIDRIFFDYKMNTTIQLSLVAVFIGSIFYSFSDYTLRWNGYHWVILNTLCAVLIPLVEKRILNNWMPSISPISMNFSRNLLSLPIFYIILAISNDTNQVANALASLGTVDIIYIGITSVFGFLIGLSYFFLLKLVTNTSISIANSCYKLITLVLSFIFFGVTFSTFGWCGIVLSFIGVFTFSYESTRPKK